MVIIINKSWEIYVYITGQEFNMIRISVLRDEKKNLKKINHIKEVKNIYFA